MDDEDVNRLMKQNGLQTDTIDSKKPLQLLGSLGLLVGASVAGYSLLHEPLNIGLEEVTIRLPHAQGHFPDRGLRILHLSDTHFRGLAWREQAKIQRIHQLTAGMEYDLLIHTGDFWHEEPGLANVLALLDGLPRPRLGGFGVYGNHDHVCYSHSDMWARNWERYQRVNGKSTNGHVPTFSEQVRDFYEFAKFFMNRPFVLKRIHFNDRELLRGGLAEQGLEILDNRTVHLCHRPGEADGVDLYLAGVDDLAEGWPDLPKVLADIPAGKPTILLSHNPDILQEPAIQQVDVVLAGHTHGGQIVLPWIGPVHTHSDHLARHEACGYLRRGKTHVYVTRGVGEGIPLRFGARPQITLITIQG
jgi:hypothetical protein